MKNEEKLVNLLNDLFSILEPITYDEFNKIMVPKNEEDLIELEKKYNELGIFDNDSGIPSTSIVALIATITDMLIGKRLAIKINKETGIIEGFKWYTEG